MAPEQDCLQYLTASTGTIASFNFDTTATGSVATSQTHLSNQYYSICIRRARGYCSLCFSPEITSTTTINPTAGSQVGKGDYLEIAGLQDGTRSSTAAGSATVARICGVYWDATTGGAQTSHATACSYATPFKVGVHFDNDEAIAAPAAAASPDLDKCENCPIATNSGRGYQGFYLAYWQNTC